MSKKGNYKVGYKKPPVSSQFKPGQSGNPRGRPKGTKNLKTDLQEELSMKITISENGSPITVSKQRVILKALTAKAMKGDIRAINSLLLQIARSNLDEEVPEENLTEADEVILEDFLRNQNKGEKE